MIDDILTRLKEPDHKYKPIPFWSWNGKLDPDELRRQVRDMAEAGFGGYFIHARAGLKTAYFSREWMDCIAACVDEGAKAGVSTWLYDEDGYPSGFAGGAVPALGLAYQQKHLCFEEVSAKSLRPDPATLAVYRRLDGSWRRADPAGLVLHETALRAYYTVNPFYSDLLNADAVRAFIDSTYEPYYREFGEHFGREIPGIFTDEPQYGRSGMPWSFAIPDAFSARHGYDVLDCLPALYEEAPGCHRLREDFWETVAALFSDNCAGQLARWCEEHHCLLTGHVLLEESMRYQTLCSGSAMGIYSRMHVPGIDWLGRKPGNPVIVKQVASAAAQTGRELVLSEMFAAAGWNTTLAGLKRIAEWQYALGINLTCAHLYAYSQIGMRKKDHPPGISYQSNWWEQCRAFNDTFTRLGMLMSQGAPGETLLIVHPLHSGWAALDASCGEYAGNGETERLDGQFVRLSELLTGLHLEYHYADEGMLAEMGGTGDGAITVGRCRYRAVLVPPSTTLEPATARLLNAFADGGGKLYAFEDFPTMLHGTPDPVLAALKARCELLTMDPEGLAPLESAGCRSIHVTDAEGREVSSLWHRVAIYPDGAAAFLVNMDEHGSASARIRVPGNRGAWRVDLTACQAAPLPTGEDGSVDISFEPCQSAVLFFTKEPAQAVPAPAEPARQTVRLEGPWRVSAQSPNALLLDVCRYRVEGGLWSAATPVARVQEELLALGRSADVEMEFTVESGVDFAERELWLVVEDLENCAISVNGTPVENKPAGWWKDVAFGKLDLSDRIVTGTNTIVLRTRFLNSPQQMDKLERAKQFEAERNMLTYLSEVENAYLIGDFAVSTGPATGDDNDSFRVTGQFCLEPRREATSAELTTGGWPFFSGRVALEQEFELKGPVRHAVFTMAAPYCAYCSLSVNGQTVKTFLWQPWEAEIGPYLREGRNTVTLELVSTDRNLFGPHHHPAGELTSLGPVQFTDLFGWDERYSLVRFGLGEQVRVEIQ